jgi:hypothetical protein
VRQVGESNRNQPLHWDNQRQTLIQILKYEKDQFYKTHNDYAAEQRILGPLSCALRLFVRVEEGGGRLGVKPNSRQRR